MIQYFSNGIEYTTRAKLADRYELSLKGGVLQDVLADEKLLANVIVERNQFYYVKDETELTLEKAIEKKRKK